jgi:hypothetical protein
MMPTTITAPTTIHVHGTSVDVVLVVFSVVVDEPGAAGADCAPEPDPEPVVVVVVPFVVVLCANDIAGAMRRKRARSIMLRRKIGRMEILPEKLVEPRFPRKRRVINLPPLAYCFGNVSHTAL